MITSGAYPLTYCHGRGITRRALLQIGYSSLVGIGMPSLLTPPTLAGASAPSARPTTRGSKSVILVFLTGAPSHLDTFDPKPDAPSEIRGEFQAIATTIAGVYVSEYLPRLAARADRYALVRSFSHRQNQHRDATHYALTASARQGVLNDKVASREDGPCYASALGYLRPRRDGIPSGVHLPTLLMEGSSVWPGQHAGFLGPSYDPWQLNRDPNAPNFRVDNLRLAAGIEVARFRDRRELLARLNGDPQRLDDLAACRQLSEQQERAFAMLSSGKVARAFDLDREPAPIRERYGRHTFGQSLLLARRLVQAGVPIVQANMGRVQSWDTHSDNFSKLKNQLLPPLDQAVAALLDDLASTGLLDETLVVMLGEFGRTPKIGIQPGFGPTPGRDHWPRCFFGLFAGAGVRGGQVIGKSDKIGAYPATAPYAPDDVGATIYHALGVQRDAEVRDRLNRPVQLNRGEVIEALFTGVAG